MSTNQELQSIYPGPATLTKEKIFHISFCSLDISTIDEEMDLFLLYLITNLIEMFIQAAVFCCVCVTQTFHQALAKC